MICIVGALAVDVLVSRERFIKGTSNPASIHFSPGGVGYRIYSHLQGPKILFTALGSDVLGKWLVEKIAHPQWVNPIFLEDYTTSCYCALMQNGELLYGASDMAVIEEGLSWPRLRARLPELGKTDFLVLEANLCPELVQSLIRHAGRRTRVVFESVSVEKLLRHSDSLKDLYLLSANEDEYGALGKKVAASQFSNQMQAAAGAKSEKTGQKSRPAWVVDFLKQRRIEHLLVTRGSRGVSLYRLHDRERLTRQDVKPGTVHSGPDTTGAGDMLVAALLEAIDQTEDLEAALGLAVEEVEKAIKEGSL
jgi:sugar/nucleoside kinase (ribokinase family)